MVIREGVKFCTLCGKRMSGVCPNCLESFLDGDNFCGLCSSNLSAEPSPVEAEPAGTDLTTHRLKTVHESIPQELAQKIESSRQAGEGERKNVTVLFANISGFTAMSELMDPEEVSTIMNSCFKALSGCIYQFEGFIDKFIGDCIMALFGAPVAHENHPELAIRASLDMMRELEKLNKGLKKKLDKPLALHIGINSGMVIAGKVGSDYKMDYTVMGYTVNLASRLESAANLGDVFVSQYTYNLTRNLFDFETLEPMAIKGKREPVAVYKVLKVKSRRKIMREVKGFSAPMIGRGKDYERALHCVEDLNNGEGQVITILSEAGIGKSRFFGEFKAPARSQTGLPLYRATAFHTDIPYHVRYSWT
jgi:class 3 adenylate cyclase